MKQEELDNLWKLYREFCLACNQSNMVNATAEFLAWLERFRVQE